MTTQTEDRYDKLSRLYTDVINAVADLYDPINGRQIIADYAVGFLVWQRDTNFDRAEFPFKGFPVYAEEHLPQKRKIWTLGDELFDYITSEFGPKTTDDHTAIGSQVNDLFENKLVINTLDNSELRSYPDVVVSISIARALITTYRAPFDTIEMHGFDQFARLYRRYIMGD